MENTLYYGDNLEILRDYIKDETIDLIYLDPPFQSGKNYNQIFQPEDFGVKGATSQIQAFGDTWKWGPEAREEFYGLINGTITTEHPDQELIELMKLMMGYLTPSSLLAYLCMMAPRLLEMKRGLKQTGSIYLHCDPTASHYLKLLMDAVFGVNNFRNEIVWVYNRPSSPKQKQLSRTHDIIFWYAKSDKWIFKPDKIRNPYSESSQSREGYSKFFHQKGDLKEKKCILNKRGKFPQDWWDIPFIRPNAKERLGYPTQKPEKLLERIIEMSSNERDLVLDPFCGCGTTIAVAEKTRRKWIGIDITYLAIDVIKKRLERNHIKENEHFKVCGVPKDIHSARKLAEIKPLDFERWAVSQLNATPTVRTADKGVDGIINFYDRTKKEEVGKGIISVKSGHNINPAMVRDLKGTIQSQNADFGILITLQKPTKGMIEEVFTEGSFDYCYHEGTIHKKIPKIQFLTVEDLFKYPIPINLPPGIIEPYGKPDIKKENRQQLSI